jgi:hypothetical protein
MFWKIFYETRKLLFHDLFYKPAMPSTSKEEDDEYNLLLKDLSVHALVVLTMTSKVS